MTDPLRSLAQRTASPDQGLAALHQLEPELKIQDAQKKSALLMLLGNSPFLRRWALKYPASLSELCASPNSFNYNFNDYIQEFEKYNKNYLNLSREEFARQLIHFKYRHLFRISWQEFGKEKTFPEVTLEWSELARANLEIALSWHLHQAFRDWGKALQLTPEIKPIPFCIMALGKLGGGELNFSSDIDLQYFYLSDEGEVRKDGKKQERSPHQYFNQLCEKLTQFLSQKTDEGFLYRIDLELRPEGKAGVLANSLSALELYYENFGADWEKQALIKAAWGAGDPKLFEEFSRRIQPFVYPKIRDYSFLENLRKMKDRVLASIKDKSSFHLKLGDGGIREIEFFVQCLQFLLGGKMAMIRTPNTLIALDRLKEAKLISVAEKKELEQAYIFLRTMEHRLQLVEEQQIHQLPSDPEELGQLARRMGYLDVDMEVARQRMEHDLEHHVKFVKRSFRELLSHKIRE